MLRWTSDANLTGQWWKCWNLRLPKRPGGFADARDSVLRLAGRTGKPTACNFWGEQVAAPHWAVGPAPKAQANLGQVYENPMRTNH